MIRRLLPMLLISATAVIGLGHVQSGPMTGALVVAFIAAGAAAAVAATRMLMRAGVAAPRFSAEFARDAWLRVTITHSPGHWDARALMRPRPPSLRA